LDVRFLFRYFESIRQQLIDQGKGGAQSNISQGIIRETIVPVPPLDEQRRIVAEIEQQLTRLDAGVTALRRAQANLKRYRAAVLKAACEGRLVPTETESTQETGTELLDRILNHRREEWAMERAELPPKAYVVPRGPDTTGLSKLPEPWTWASLEQLTSAVRVICYGILMPKSHVADGVLYVKVRDMKGDFIDLTALQRTSKEIAASYGRASLKQGDLLLAIRGTYGRVAEVPRELEGGNITQDTARLSLSELIDRRFVASCLRSDIAQRFFRRVARGVAVKGVNIGDVRVTPVPLPPLDDQQRIVAEIDDRLSVVDAIGRAVDQNLRRATTLRATILNRAFTKPTF
jgi:type I restriction enzyme S subunit